ncbi:hypothetical protein B0H14DRAFT_3434428 [Mycena olivaceomarginata]|nr:hypothetical protein B0H14DRAFT_3434428 [Mycena olivaceomarginata]
MGPAFESKDLKFFQSFSTKSEKDEGESAEDALPSFASTSFQVLITTRCPGPNTLLSTLFALGASITSSTIARSVSTLISTGGDEGSFAVEAEVAQPREMQKEAERDCGIWCVAYSFYTCVANLPFELAVTPLHTRCCAHLFCAEYVVAVHLFPFSSSFRVDTYNHAVAPAYARALTLSVRKPDYGRSAGRRVPEHTPRNTGSPTFSALHLRTTDYSLPAIIRARTLQTRRHVSHPFSSLVGVRAALGPLGWAVVVDPDRVPRIALTNLYPKQVWYFLATFIALVSADHDRIDLGTSDLLAQAAPRTSQPLVYGFIPVVAHP